MCIVIAISNQKGGVGKTTTASAMISGLANKCYKVLGIDMDPQGNLSDSLGSNMYDTPTIYDVLKNEVDAENAIQHLENFDIISSNIMLASAEQEITQTGKEYRLKEEISKLLDKYDYIIIDTPPSLGLLTVNAFTASNEVIIPTTAGIFSAKGINQLYNTIQNVKKYCNQNLQIKGIIITRFDTRTNISRQIKELTEQLSDHIHASLFQTHIRNGIIVEEAQANSVDIFTYSKNSNVAKDYENFVSEYLGE